MKNDGDFLKAIKEYIEQAEVQLESELGAGKTLDELIAEGCMPMIYDEVLRRLANTDR